MPDTPVSPSMRAVLQVRALHLWRGEHHLLRGVSFELAAGELLQVTGPNGVGKTSLLRVVAGLLPAESGEVRWYARRIDLAGEAYALALSYLGHVNALKPDLTALENLKYAIGMRRAITLPACRDALLKLNVAHCADLPVRVLSAGQRRRVALARVLLNDSVLWVLDEPITNLDAAGVALTEQLLAEHLSRGGMILTAAHQQLLTTHPAARQLSLQ